MVVEFSHRALLVVFLLVLSLVAGWNLEQLLVAVADDEVHSVFVDVRGKRQNLYNFLHRPALEHFGVAVVPHDLLSRLSAD